MSDYQVCREEGDFSQKSACHLWHFMACVMICVPVLLIFSNFLRPQL